MEPKLAEMKVWNAGYAAACAMETMLVQLCWDSNNITAMLQRIKIKWSNLSYPRAIGSKLIAKKTDKSNKLFKNTLC